MFTSVSWQSFFIEASRGRETPAPKPFTCDGWGDKTSENSLPPGRDATKFRTCFLVMDRGSCDLGRAIIASPPPPILCIHLFHQAVREWSQSDGSFQLLCCQRTIRSGITLHRKRNWPEIRVRYRHIHKKSLSNRTRNTSKCSITRVCHRAAGHERWSELSEKSLPTKKKKKKKLYAF
jgi:hypothetical protein